MKLTRSLTLFLGLGLGLGSAVVLLAPASAAAQTPYMSYSPHATCHDVNISGPVITRAMSTGAYVNEQSTALSALCPITVGLATLPVHKIGVVELEVSDSHPSADLGARICFRKAGGPKSCGPWSSSTGSGGLQSVQVQPPKIKATNRTTAFLEVEFAPRVGNWATAFYRYTIYSS